LYSLQGNATFYFFGPVFGVHFKVPSGPDKDAWIKLFIDRYSQSPDRGRTQLFRFATWILEYLLENDHILEREEDIFRTALQGINPDAHLEELSKSVAASLGGAPGQNRYRLHAWCAVDACHLEDPGRAKDMLSRAAGMVTWTKEQSERRILLAKQPGQRFLTAAAKRDLAHIYIVTKQEFLDLCRAKLMELIEAA
jgi:hypothetical protein